MTPRFPSTNGRPVTEPIVRATQIEKTYDTGKVTVNALRGIDLTLKRGEMVAIMGPSGCGKTTLLTCLSGLDSIDAGEIEIEGTPLQAMSDRQRTDYRARRMGFVFQFYNLMPVLTAVENVELPLLVARVPSAEARRKALDALELVGLRDRAAHVPEELSGGERQRVTIARSLVNDPAIVWAVRAYRRPRQRESRGDHRPQAPPQPRARPDLPHRHTRHLGWPQDRPDHPHARRQGRRGATTTGGAATCTRESRCLRSTRSGSTSRRLLLASVRRSSLD
jgi:ABC-type lipoprotein export system ATPase subunit